MCLEVLGNIFRCNFQGIALLTIITVLAGCSSGTQRFSHHDTSMESNMFSTMPTDSQVLSNSGIIQSAELPPMESSGGQEIYNSSAPDNFQQRGGEFFSDSRMMGMPPRNLGMLSRSQVNSTSLFQRNSYIVQSGDTLLSIARQIGVSVDELKLANGISNNSIYIGQLLMIPTRSTGVTSNAHNGDKKGTSKIESSLQSQVTSSVKHKESSPLYKSLVTVVPSAKVNRKNVEQRSSRQISSLSHEIGNLDSAMNENNDVAPQATGISKMRWPVRGRLLSQFGQRKGTATNRGIDIAVPEGSSVKAAENGIVIYASDGLKELGNVVMIRHENNIITIYGYNSELIVNKGQRVRRGDEIAKSGVSGNVKTPRVYFEVRKNSEPVDPIKYLEN
ncbi:M23 family metallopeptidase [Bartonella doshiae]|uniref:Murein hydrolase activator NlpD n=2 Tax=Bartonella doshiae TaxID=33044 RepID=A0A380ZCN3_BARDO|nr:M23 family metallopeptidase [Bartonella doshiae]EJF81876.1 hypothetical protein MCS_00301 [Bartonella doshiae NCTC 12862 = ATCC 700133]SUV44697.1 Murein hydrolase activator NlpD precursor [Bartonella doshiae]